MKVAFQVYTVNSVRETFQPEYVYNISKKVCLSGSWICKSNEISCQQTIASWFCTGSLAATNVNSFYLCDKICESIVGMGIQMHVHMANFNAKDSVFCFLLVFFIFLFICCCCCFFFLFLFFSLSIIQQGLQGWLWLEKQNVIRRVLIVEIREMTFSDEVTLCMYVWMDGWIY